jgi:UDP-N-acetylmuramyl tripeptide synthase
VLVAGKGHEQVQIIGGERRAFSDQRVVRDLLTGKERA